MTVDELKELLGKVVRWPWVWQAEEECLIGPDQIVLIQDDEGRMTFAQYPDGKHFDHANILALSPQIAAALIEAMERLRKLDYWHDTDTEILNDMSAEVLDDHNYVHGKIRATISRIDAILEGKG